MILEKIKYVLVHTVKWAYLLFFLAVALLPLIWLFLSSFKTEAEFITAPLALPSSWQLDNYVNAVTVAKMHVLFMNSIIIATTATMLNLLVTSMGAFVMSREK